MGFSSSLSTTSAKCVQASQALYSPDTRVQLCRRQNGGIIPASARSLYSPQKRGRFCSRSLNESSKGRRRLSTNPSQDRAYEESRKSHVPKNTQNSSAEELDLSSDLSVESRVRAQHLSPSLKHTQEERVQLCRRQNGGIILASARSLFPSLSFVVRFSCFCTFSPVILIPFPLLDSE